MTKKVYVLDGKIINVGNWECQKVINDDGEEVVENPVPEGTIEEEREMGYDEERGWYEVGKPVLPTDKERIEMLEDTILFLLMGGM